MTAEYFSYCLFIYDETNLFCNFEVFILFAMMLNYFLRVYA